MTNWILRRRGVDVPQNSFKFDKHFVLHPNRSVKVCEYLLIIKNVNMLK